MCLQKKYEKKSLNSSEYDIGWDYDVYSLTIWLNYSKPLVIWTTAPCSPPLYSISGMLLLSLFRIKQGY